MKKTILLSALAIILTFSLILTGCQTNPSTSDSTSATVSENSAEVSNEVSDDTSIEESEPAVVEFDYDVYETAFNKTVALTSFYYTMHIDMSLVMTGLTMDLTLDSDVKAEIDGENEKGSSVVTIGMLGTNNETKTYYEDGFAYMETIGMKYKMPSTFADSIGVSSSLLDTEAIKDSKVEVVDGITQYVLVVDGEAFANSDSSNMLSEMIDSAATGATIDEVIIDDVEYIVVLNDGYLSTETVSGKITMNGIAADGETPMNMEIEFTVSNVLNNPGEEVTIETPADLDEYTLIEIEE
ncbi:MAG: hypothetical protein PHY15_08845 [Eubacteriales bacterium]|nr:hypothetical protein [Eubacteriales bacterium]MDD4475354.1 hypothetical protein [Eubacteriales bacterium]